MKSFIDSFWSHFISSSQYQGPLSSHLLFFFSWPALLLYVSQDHYHNHKTVATSVYKQSFVPVFYSSHASSYHSSCSFIIRKGVASSTTTSVIQFNDIKKITCNIYIYIYEMKPKRDSSCNSCSLFLLVFCVC